MKRLVAPKTVAEEKAHSEFGASASYRWLNCPGSVQLSRKAPPQRESSFALEGTRAHACLESIFMRAIELSGGLSFEGVLGYLRNHRPEGDGWDDDMIRHGKNAVAWIMKEFYARGPSTELRCEQKVSSEPFTCKGQFGTLDAALIEPFGRLTIIDYKYGAGIAVDPKSPQLIYYALGVSHEFHHNFEEVELVVIQPRAHHESGKRIRRARISVDEMLSWERRFQKGVKAALAKKPPLVSGDWCRFCPAASMCPELVERNFERAQIVFSKVDGIESVPEPRLVKEWDMRVMLEAADKLEIWIEQLRSHAFHMLEHGERIEGFKLVQKRATRKWADPDQVKEFFGDMALHDPEMKSPAQLEDTIKKMVKHKETRAQLLGAIKNATIGVSSGVTMVKDGDKREAIGSRAERVFGAITIDV